MEKETAIHAFPGKNLAWEIPWTEEPDKLQFIGLQRGRHDLATKQQQQQHICIYLFIDGFTLY